MSRRADLLELRRRVECMLAFEAATPEELAMQLGAHLWDRRPAPEGAVILTSFWNGRHVASVVPREPLLWALRDLAPEVAARVEGELAEPGREGHFPVFEPGEGPLRWIEPPPLAPGGVS